MPQGLNVSVVDGRVLLLVLDKPAVNAMSADILAAMSEALDAAQDDRQLRAIMDRGAGQELGLGHAAARARRAARLRPGAGPADPSRAPLSVEATKRVANQALDLSAAASTEAIRREMAPLLASRDHKEALAAFAEKREPVFRREGSLGDRLPAADNMGGW